MSHPAAQLNGRADGAISEDGQILATYLHGAFESAPAADALLRWAGLAEPRSSDHAAIREAGIDDLADAVETHLDLDRIFEILNLAQKPPAHAHPKLEKETP